MDKSEIEMEDKTYGRSRYEDIDRNIQNNLIDQAMRFGWE